MKRFAIFFIFSLVLSAFGREIPEFHLNDTENRIRDYSEVKGEKLTVIDFWATWCKPCIRSIPELVKIEKSFSGKGVSFVGISTDGPRNQMKVKPVAKSLGITYPVLIDINGELAERLQINVVPTLLIVNAQDKIVYRHQGYRAGDENEWIKEIEKNLTQEIQK